MGTRYNRLAEAVLTSTHYLCFEQKYEQYQNVYLKIFFFFFLLVKFSVYLKKLCFRNVYRELLSYSYTIAVQIYKIFGSNVLSTSFRKVSFA